MTTYKIVRYYKPIEKKSKVVMTGLTLDEAKEHCRQQTSHSRQNEWFEGYSEE